MIGVLWDWGGEFYFATVGLVCGGSRLGGTASIAVGVHLEDDGVVHEPVDDGDGHCGIWEDLIPGAEGLVGGDHDRASFVSCADQLEED